MIEHTYFPDTQEAVDEMQDFLDEFEEKTETVERLDQLLTKIDCDQGGASLEVAWCNGRHLGFRVKMSATVPEMTDQLEELVDMAERHVNPSKSQSYWKIGRESLDDKSGAHRYWRFEARYLL